LRYLSRRVLAAAAEAAERREIKHHPVERAREVLQRRQCLRLLQKKNNKRHTVARPRAFSSADSVCGCYKKKNNNKRHTVARTLAKNSTLAQF
jgi:hypothetical protein